MPNDTEPPHTPKHVIAGRKHIADLARADGELTFAREVEVGCWDHRNDVRAAIARAQVPA